jgi:hypothetical protein
MGKIAPVFFAGDRESFLIANGDTNVYVVSIWINTFAKYEQVPYIRPWF